MRKDIQNESFPLKTFLAAIFRFEEGAKNFLLETSKRQDPGVARCWPVVHGKSH